MATTTMAHFEKNPSEFHKIWRAYSFVSTKGVWTMPCKPYAGNTCGDIKTNVLCDNYNILEHKYSKYKIRSISLLFSSGSWA